MQKWILRGRRPLNGEITIGSMKNAALPILFATVLTRGASTLHNLPHVSDIGATLRILQSMGADVTFPEPHSVCIDTEGVRPCTAPDELVRSIRGSSYLLGAELGRFGKTRVAFPGGCDFGPRPLDVHFKAFEALGAQITEGADFAKGSAPRGLRGARVDCAVPVLNIASVGATINVMLAAVLAQGETLIDNAAREPHIVDLANFLNACGADISGAGTSQIRIHGVQNLHGIEYRIVPDMIEAGTFMVAAAATGGHVTLHGVIPKHMEAVTYHLGQAGAEVTSDGESITVDGRGCRRGKHELEIKTLPYPGFPTDMHPQFAALLAVLNGVGVIHETIFENRFRYVDEMALMGADMTVDGRAVTIRGGKPLHGASVTAADLRAGAAMVIAGLVAEGETEILGVEKVERGYDDMVGKLRSLGADIERIEE